METHTAEDAKSRGSLLLGVRGGGGGVRVRVVEDVCVREGGGGG